VRTDSEAQDTSLARMVAKLLRQIGQTRAAIQNKGVIDDSCNWSARSHT